MISGSVPGACLMPASFHWYVGQLKFTLLAAAVVIPPIAVSTTVAAYCVSLFDIGVTAFKAIEIICFFAVLAAEAFAYDKFRRWRLFRREL
jgi:hypothetical protein